MAFFIGAALAMCSVLDEGKRTVFAHAGIEALVASCEIPVPFCLVVYMLNIGCVLILALVHNTMLRIGKPHVLLVDDFKCVHAYIKLYPYADFTNTPCNQGLL